MGPEAVKVGRGENIRVRSLAVSVSPNIIRRLRFLNVYVRRPEYQVRGQEQSSGVGDGTMTKLECMHRLQTTFTCIQEQ